MKQNNTTIGILLAVLGVVLFSAKAVMVKLAYQYEVSSVNLLLFRMLFSLPIYLIMLFVYKPNNYPSITKKDYLWLLFFGFLGYYLASFLDFEGLQYIKAGLERVILFIYPTLILIITRIFFKKKITQLQMIAIAITYLGIIITFSQELDIGSSKNLWLGTAFILGSALTYAGYLVGSGWLIPKFGVKTFTSYAMIIACFFAIMHYLVSSREPLWNYTYQVYVLGFLMAIFSTVIPSYLVSAAISRLGAPKFGIIASIGPISTIILASIFLDEKFTLIQFLGAILVIIGIYIANSKPEKAKR